MKSIGERSTLGVLRLRVPKSWDATLRMALLWRDKTTNQLALTRHFVESAASLSSIEATGFGAAGPLGLGEEGA